MLYGLPTVEVVDPDGEVREYLVRPVPAPPGSWRAWALTSPEGKTYTVTESPAGRWACTCPAYLYRRPPAGAAARTCKHAAATQGDADHAS